MYAASWVSTGQPQLPLELREQVTGDFDTEAGFVPSSESTMARDEPESLFLAQKSPIPKARKLGRKLQTPGLERKQRQLLGEGPTVPHLSLMPVPAYPAPH